MSAPRKRIPIGTEFALYGWALDGTRNVLVASVQYRRKTDDGSKVIRIEGRSESWPNTAKGARAADDWSFAMNVAEGDRVGVVS